MEAEKRSKQTPDVAAVPERDREKEKKNVNGVVQQSLYSLGKCTHSEILAAAAPRREGRRLLLGGKRAGRGCFFFFLSRGRGRERGSLCRRLHGDPGINERLALGIAPSLLLFIVVVMQTTTTTRARFSQACRFFSLFCARKQKLDVEGA